MAGRFVVACVIGTVGVMVFHIPHGSWMIMTIFTVGQADAGASLQKGGQRIVGTVAGGLAGLAVVMLFIDMPEVFVPLLGVAVAISVYLSHTSAAPYPPLLGGITYCLVALSHVESPEDYVDVALWRITAIVLGVALSTAAQLFLWPDDPLVKLRRELVRRLDVVPLLVDHALHAAPSAPLPSPAVLGMGDLTSQLQLLTDAEILHPRLRGRDTEHVGLVLEIARLFTGALWAAETVPETRTRLGADRALEARLLAIRDESVRFARALEGRSTWLAGRASGSMAAGPGATAQEVAAAAPIIDGMERSLDRIAFLMDAPRQGREIVGEPPAGILGPADRPGAAPPARLSLDVPALKVALKAALGVVLSYLVMVGVAWPGIVTATITCVIVAQSTVGANTSKAVLRQIGAVLGGVLGLIAVVVFMPNLQGLASFLVVATMGYSIAAWIAAGGPRTAYAGIQTALAFGILMLNDFGPQTDLVAGRDRVIGILLGAAIMGVIDQVIWPVQARRAMRPTLARALRMMASLARAGARTGGPGDHPRGFRARIYHTLAQALALRDEARMEGDPDTPANRAESDMILHVVTDAQALLPGLLAAAAERLAGPAPATPLTRHVEEYERAIADVLDATATAVERGMNADFIALRERARALGEADDPDALAHAEVGDQAGARLVSRHVTSHQLVRLVARLGPEVEAAR